MDRVTIAGSLGDRPGMAGVEEQVYPPLVPASKSRNWLAETLVRTRLVLSVSWAVRYSRSLLLSPWPA